jgi:hypothetical protein
MKLDVGLLHHRRAWTKINYSVLCSSLFTRPLEHAILTTLYLDGQWWRRFHVLNSQWVFYPAAGHDRGLPRGVPHDVEWGRKFRPPFPQMAQYVAPLAPTTTAIWKENALAMMMFPPWTVVPRLETNQPSEQHHANHKRKTGAIPCSASPCWTRIGVTMKQPYWRVDCNHDLARCVSSAWSYAQDGEDHDGGLHLHSEPGQIFARPVRQGEAWTEVIAAWSPSASPLLTDDGVNRIYHQVEEIHTIVTA